MWTATSLLWSRILTLSWKSYHGLLLQKFGYILIWCLALVSIPNHGEVNGCDHLEEDEKYIKYPFRIIWQILTSGLPLVLSIEDIILVLAPNSNLASFVATGWAMMGIEELNTLLFL